MVSRSLVRCLLIALATVSIRLWKEGGRDVVMEICCALHNFRVRLTPWQPMGLIGINSYVPDVAASLAFFTRAFGLARRFLHESETYGELETGAAQFIAVCRRSRKMSNGPEKASKRLASVQAMRPATEKRDAVP